MTSQIQSQLLPVSFHGDTLFVVSHEGQPFTPVRPLVAAIGIDWKSQHRKLVSNQGRWGVVIMTTVTKTGPKEALCIPVRKLTAFLSTIDPRKVRPAIRTKVELYQNECDDALWSYWTKGEAVNPRRVEAEANEPAFEPLYQIPAARPLAPETPPISHGEYVELLKTKIAYLEMKIASFNNRKPNRPLTAADVDEIKRLYSLGLTQGECARRTGRSTATVHFIVKGAQA